MLVVELCSKRETTSVNDAGVVAIVADDIVATTNNCGDYTAVHEETCRETESVVLADVLRKFFFKLYVNIERTVEEAATCATRTVFVESCLTSINDALIAGKSGISVRAEHKDLVSAHFYFCALLARNLTKIGINTFCHVLLWKAIAFILFL